MDRVLSGLAGVFLAIFAVVWLVICWRVLKYMPTEVAPVVDLPERLVVTAGFVATAVGGGTAAVLGIEIQKIKSNQTLSTASALGAALKNDRLLVTGIVVYAAIGLAVLLVWLFFGDRASEVVEAFGLSILGWFAGAFSGVFRAGD
jgi:hypothetical protein